MTPRTGLGHDADRARNGQKRSGDAEESPEKQLPHKRSRVSRACDQCRASREKCDGTQPTCHTCTSQRRACTYHEQPKKRGIQPNYIRTLEMTIAWLLRASPGTEHQLASHLSAADDAVHHIISAKDSDGAEALHQRWRGSVICRQIDQMLSGAPIESVVAGHVDQLYGSPAPSAPNDQVPTQADSLSVLETEALNELRKQSYGSAAKDTNSHGTAPHNNDAQSQLHTIVNNAEPPRQAFCSGPGLELQPPNYLANVQLPENTWTLLEYYFAFTHTWMPIADKQSILKLVYTYPSGGLSHDLVLDPSSRYGELCSILELSAIQLERSGQFPRPAVTGQLQEVASALITTVVPPLSISHARVVLLHAVIQIISQSWTKAWFLVSRAIRVLLRLEATDMKDGTHFSDVQPIKLSAFVIESAVARQLGISSVHMRPEDVEQIGLMNEDGNEEWSPWHDPLAATASKAPAMSCSTLNRLVRLSLQYFNVQGRLHINAPDSANAALLANGGTGAFAARISNAVSPFSSPTMENSGIEANPASAVHAPQAVLALVQNAVLAHGRLQPSAVLATFEERATSNGKHSDPTIPSQQPRQPIGFMSLPNESADKALSHGPSFLRSGTEERIPRPNEASTADLFDFDSIPAPSDYAGPGADIFEELAMLERADSTHNPQFMQNLGFQPDFDLAEFFGADYQPSDPLLAYLQTSLISTPSGSASGQQAGDPG